MTDEHDVMADVYDEMADADGPDTFRSHYSIPLIDNSSLIDCCRVYSQRATWLHRHRFL